MAGMMDRLRNRMQGQRPVGAAQGMPMGAQIPDIGRKRQAEEPDAEMLMAPETAETAEARRLGERMGAQGLLDMMGLSAARKDELMAGGRIMNAERLNQATETLLKYKKAKASVNRRVIAAQQWWKLKNWEEITRNRGTKGATVQKNSTGWLWNSIVGKHADAIDSFPEPVILPRMEDDQEEAKRLSKIVPVVMDMNDFEETYNNCSWQKMQEGTGVYGVFWNSQKLNGLGDIDIPKINILNLYWEPGINDIEESRNVFFVSFEDKKDLEEIYPQLKGNLGSNKISVDQYKTDDTQDLGNKAVVVDWYYKVYEESGRAILHYCKYVGETCLYSSEEEGLENGYYEDGEYPFVLDRLFPVEGSPAGYGYIDIGKDVQTDIDEMSQAMVLNAKMRATPRYFMRKDGGVNEAEFADISKPIIHTNGNLGQDTLRAVDVPAMGGDAHNMLMEKIDEIKWITGNMDVNNGGVPSGVTAASAIAALKEDSGRSSKDSTKAAYRAYKKIVLKVIERIRQFYDIERLFRIMGPQGQEEFVRYDNANLQPQTIPNLPGQEPGMRLPVFDVEVRAQRENAYTKMSQNELALQFYGNGFFTPQMTNQALMALSMMDFRGKDELVKKIEQQGTMQDALMQMGQIAMALAEGDPEIQGQIAGVMQGMSAEMGMPMPQGAEINPQLRAPADNMSAPNPNENAIVARAKERAANASRPE